MNQLQFVSRNIRRGLRSVSTEKEEVRNQRAPEDLAPDNVKTSHWMRSGKVKCNVRRIRKVKVLA